MLAVLNAGTVGEPTSTGSAWAVGERFASNLGGPNFEQARAPRAPFPRLPPLPPASTLACLDLAGLRAGGGLRVGPLRPADARPPCVQAADRRSIGDRRLARLGELYPGKAVARFGFGAGDGVVCLEEGFRLATAGTVTAVVKGEDETLAGLLAEQLVKGEASVSTLEEQSKGFVAFVYDAGRQSVMLARSKEGPDALWWGSSADGFLVFSNDKNLVNSTDSSLKPVDEVCEFPAGKLFAAGGGTTAQLHTFAGLPEVVGDDAPKGTDGRIYFAGRASSHIEGAISSGNLSSADTWRDVMGDLSTPRTKSLASAAAKIAAMQRWIQGK